MPRLTNGLEQVLTNLGIVGSGYKLFFFETGTTTLKTTYSDEDLTVANTNPIVLNSAGRPDVDVWGSDPSLYRMILGTPNSVVGNITTVVDVDPVDNYQVDNLATFNPIPTAYWGATAGTSTAYTLEEPLVDITSYSNTQTFFVDIHIACGASPTFKVKDLPAITLKKYTGQGTKVNLKANDIQIQRYLCINDGTDVVVLNPTSLPIQSGSGTSLTIATGTITLTNNSSSYVLDTEGAAASDDLDTINGGQDGQIIYIRSTASARNIVVRHNTGNIFNPIGVNIILDTTEDIIELRYSSSMGKWIVVTTNNVSYFLNSKTTNGYTYLPNGLIFQWGISGSISPDSGSNITFPIAFPNAVLNANCNATGLPTDTSDVWSYTRSLSTSGFRLSNGSAATTSTFYWQAIGY